MRLEKAYCVEVANAVNSEDVALGDIPVEFEYSVRTTKLSRLYEVPLTPTILKYHDGSEEVDEYEPAANDTSGVVVEFELNPIYPFLSLKLMPSPTPWLTDGAHTGFF